MITFDDAWLDVYAYAFPILREFGHHFTIFTISNWTDRASEKAFQPSADHAFPTHDGAMRLIKEKRGHEVICSWEHLREMQASGLCSVENHSANHRHATQQEPAALRADLIQCREAIRQQLGRDSQQLCWPRGSHNAKTLALAKDLGFATTYLVRRGVNLVGYRSFGVKRFTVEDRNEVWLEKQVRIFSRPLFGFLYARLKPDRWFPPPDDWRPRDAMGRLRT
jgi:peptidoglycan/xylan/chitin deacetylase (PgdA/CDA1 family)